MWKDSLMQDGNEYKELVDYKNINEDYPNTYWYQDIKDKYIPGVLKSNKLVNGKLLQTYSKDETHAMIIASTRLGKTTQGVVPLVTSFARQLVKRSFIISDPKCELYRLLSNYLRDLGYDVLLINFLDYSHSELWNPFTPIYREYHMGNNVYDTVVTVEVDGKIKYKFNNVIFDDENKLNKMVEKVKDAKLKEVDSKIEKLSFILLPPDKGNDQYWNNASRQFLKAIIYSMLEDSLPENGSKINEASFNFDKLFNIFDSLTDDEQYDNDEYFSKRGKESKAFIYANSSVIHNANSTRMCVVSNLSAKMEVYKNSNVRLITSGNSFEASRLTSNKPVALFICYPDESEEIYQLISAFVKNTYDYLIDYSRKKPSGKLDVPFYFILDEFGNFPRIPDFKTTISACGGRNIWFYVVLQSYSQLNEVYGDYTAQIIRNNLNLHVFLGSNEYNTLYEYSLECGKTTRQSPMSVFKGDKEEITNYEYETIPLIPMSKLSKFSEGECIITEVNTDVFFSKLERYYKCDELSNFDICYESDYDCKIFDIDDEIKAVKMPNIEEYYKKAKDYLINNNIKKFTLAELDYNLKLGYKVAKKVMDSLMFHKYVEAKDGCYEYIKVEEEDKPKKSGKHLSKSEELQARRRELLDRLAKEFEDDHKDDDEDDDDIDIDIDWENYTNPFKSRLMLDRKLDSIAEDMEYIADKEFNIGVPAKIIKYVKNEDGDLLWLDESMYESSIEYEDYKNMFNDEFAKKSIFERNDAIIKAYGLLKHGDLGPRDRAIVKRLLFMLISCNAYDYDAILDMFIKR